MHGMNEQATFINKYKPIKTVFLQHHSFMKKYDNYDS